MKIGLALGGGGVKGLAHIEYLKVFDKLGIKPSIISGTSMGALIGALYASGMSVLEIEDIAKMKLSEIIKIVDLSWNPFKGLIKGDKFLKWYESKLLCNDFKDLKIPLKVIATDFDDGKQVIINKGKISDAVRSSISIPGVFKPNKVGTNFYVDGGCTNPVPYDVIMKDCDFVIAINVLGRFPKYTKEPNIYDSIAMSYEIMNRSLEESKRKLYKPDIYISLNLGNIYILEFNKKDEVLEIASKEAKKFEKDLLKIKNEGMIRRIIRKVFK